MNHTGDDLEDDFILDDTVALSGDEEPQSLVTRLDDEDIFVDLGSDDEGRDVEGEEGETEIGNDTRESAVVTGITDKKRKRREKEKERKAKVRRFCYYLKTSKLTALVSRREN